MNEERKNKKKTYSKISFNMSNLSNSLARNDSQNNRLNNASMAPLTASSTRLSTRSSTAPLSAVSTPFKLVVVTPRGGKGVQGPVGDEGEVGSPGEYPSQMIKLFNTSSNTSLISAVQRVIFSGSTRLNKDVSVDPGTWTFIPPSDTVQTQVAGNYYVTFICNIFNNSTLSPPVAMTLGIQLNENVVLDEDTATSTLAPVNEGSYTSVQIKGHGIFNNVQVGDYFSLRLMTGNPTQLGHGQSNEVVPTNHVTLIIQQV
ncbi:MAG: hypothetical protein Sylvanvirus1_38 [Sylvanvirus sp.]|uniref:Uncharacterized protein n=1 Tax=Sylvanvirus sp. TaxID=2487774 RepID=A0A3G5AGW2_9VIRU|nr:MAG: hypothetical protein Sylvanvirus1_38 [Sylvanvirus sp.]